MRNVENAMDGNEGYADLADDDLGKRTTVVDELVAAGWIVVVILIRGRSIWVLGLCSLYNIICFCVACHCIIALQCVPKIELSKVDSDRFSDFIEKDTV